MPDEKKNREVRDATFGHTKGPDVEGRDHSNRGAAQAHAEEMRTTHEDEQPAPIELPSPGIVMDPKVQALLASGKPVEVGGDNILREVKTDDE